MAYLDKESDAQVVMPVLHNRVHEGKAWSCSHYNASLANGEFVRILVKADADEEFHVGAFTPGCSGKAIYRIYEAPTVTDEGTVLTLLNKKRGSSNVAPGSAWHSPTVSGGSGTLLEAGATALLGEAVSREIEWNIADDTYYTFEIENVSGSAQAASVTVVFYEEN